MILKQYHNIIKDWEGKKYAGINLKWDYNKKICRDTIDGYMLDIRKKDGNPTPKKPQYLPHKQCTINYGANHHMAQPKDNSPYLDDKGIKLVQDIIGALIYVGRAVNKKILVALSEIRTHQKSATSEIAEAIGQLLYNVAT